MYMCFTVTNTQPQAQQQQQQQQALMMGQFSNIRASNSMFTLDMRHMNSGKPCGSCGGVK